ncbi:hypothetical protein [Bombilactobacillus bombi]|uniref:hypothetical protein n=1 Tax=Bombilactobacillus bombi TaxID=1303590 RepID=UPI0015E60C64|nr:hypothetical protein [Bombilactobacillus bombi]MBA1435158.1 hypothetical protein [Bombilactobacillus bombi]
MNIYKNKTTLFTLIMVAMIFLIAGIVMFKQLQVTKQYLLPAFNSTKSEVLISNRVDKTNQKQENAFIDFGKSAVELEDGKKNWDDFDVKSIWVKKLAHKGEYFIVFVVKSDVSSLFKPNFKTSVKMTIKQPDIRKDSKYTVNYYNSDFSKINAKLNYNDE